MAGGRNPEELSQGVDIMGRNITESNGVCLGLKAWLRK